VASLGSLKLEDLLKMNTDLQILLKKDIDLIDLNKAKGLIHYKILAKGIRLKNSSRELADHMVRANGLQSRFSPAVDDRAALTDKENGLWNLKSSRQRWSRSLGAFTGWNPDVLIGWKS
jgi:hypothetical protein